MNKEQQEKLDLILGGVKKVIDTTIEKNNLDRKLKHEYLKEIIYHCLEIW